MDAAADAPPAPARDFAELAIQVARLDERTLAHQRETAALRSEMRTLIGGLYALLVVGLTILGWLVTRGGPAAAG
jgi:hypothetical protein